jgi:hypothetical protein
MKNQAAIMLFTADAFSWMVVGMLSCLPFFSACGLMIILLRPKAPFNDSSLECAFSGIALFFRN